MKEGRTVTAKSYAVMIWRGKMAQKNEGGKGTVKNKIGRWKYRIGYGCL